MNKIETKITYQNRPIRRLKTCSQYGITLNDTYLTDNSFITFMGLDVYCYDDNTEYVGDTLIFVNNLDIVTGTLRIDADEGIQGLDFQTP